MNVSSGRPACGTVFWRMPSRVTDTAPLVLENPRALMPGIEPLSMNVVTPGASSVASIAEPTPRSCSSCCVMIVRLAGSSRTGMSSRVPPVAAASSWIWSVGGCAASTSTFCVMPPTSSVIATATGMLCTVIGRWRGTNPSLVTYMVHPPVERPRSVTLPSPLVTAVRSSLGRVRTIASIRDPCTARVGDGDHELGVVRPLGGRRTRQRRSQQGREEHELNTSDRETHAFSLCNQVVAAEAQYPVSVRLR